MKKYININIMMLAMLSILAVGCNQDDDPSDPISPDGYPVATITADTDIDGSTVDEGTMIAYTFTTDKMQAIDVAVSAVQTGGTAVEHVDFEFIEGSIGAYTTEATVYVQILDNGIPQESRTLEFEVGAQELGTRYTLNPSSDRMTVSTTINNVNADDRLTVSFEWVDPEHHSDFDLLVESLTYGSWSVDGGTGNNPEIDASVGTQWDADPNAYDDTYIFGVDPYDVGDQVTEYTVSVGHPDGTVEIFTGSFDLNATADYPSTYFAYWGVDIYNILSVVKSGNTYDVTFVGPQ